MIKRLVGALALAAIATTGAQAQFEANFGSGFGTFNSTTEDYASFYGVFNSSTGVTGRTIGTTFQIFCVDEFQRSNDFVPNVLGPGYNVWVTPLSAAGSAFGNTREVTDLGQTGDAAKTRYLNAAALASAMTQAGITVPATGNGSSDSNLQFALWDVLGYPGRGPCTSTNSPVTACLQNQDVSGYYNDATVLADEAAFKPDNPAFFANQWLLITEFDPNTNSFQEFLYNGPGRPESTVPEPGTMALLAVGLVGIAGSGLRRRKIKQ